MSHVALVGSGAVAVRAARQLVDTPGLAGLRIAARDAAAAGRLARAVGAETVPLERALDGDPAALAIAIPGAAGVALVRRAIEGGIPAASCADDDVALRGLLALGPAAFDRDVRVVIGCALVPGIADVLARHAADALDDPDEVHVARVGVAGPSCHASLRQAMRSGPREWRNGDWHVPERRGPQLVWLPEPVAVRECTSIAAGVELLQSTVTEARDITVRAEAPPRRVPSRRFGKRTAASEFGGARVEVWGWQGGVRTSIVYGVIERPAIAAGTALAVSAARLSGLIPSIGLRTEHGGARAMSATFDAGSVLAELARRGVKAAAFEGARE
ncbi:MAG: hypothetical protein R6X23_09335 [Acidimicrobiia bacterium]